MKRITAIVLSALLLITTFLSVPFITMAETAETVNVDVDFSESFYTLSEVSSAVTTGTQAPLNYVTVVTDPDSATAAEHGQVASLTSFRKLAAPDSDWWNTSKCAANILLPATENGTKLLGVKANTEYNVSFDVKVTSATSNVRVEFMSSPADNYSGGTNIRAGGVLIKEISSTQSSWLKVNATYIAPNDGDLYFVIRSTGNQFSGQAYFDNIRITEVVTTAAKYYTDVDFTENVWDDTTATQMGATIADGAVKFHRYGAYNESDQTWMRACIRVPNSDASGWFQIEQGVTYQISYKIKVNDLFGSFMVRTRGLAAGSAFGNMRGTSTELLSNEGSETDWVTRTAEFTPDNSGDMALVLYGQAGIGNWDNMAEVYIDDIKVSIKNNITYANVTDTTDLPATILSSDKYEDVLVAPAAENFGGWYLDAEYKTPAAGYVDAKGGVTVYAKYYDYTSIDFSESFYKDATYADSAYSYEQGTYSGNKGVASYVDLQTDAVKGDVVKYKKISATSNGNAERWPNIIRIADNNGTAPFIVKPGKKYIVSYDVNAVTASSSFDICLTSITEYNGLSDIKATSTYFPYVAVNTESGATNGWVTRQNIVFTPSWDYESQLCLIIRKSGGTAYSNQEIYFDNITICEATTLTVNANNGETAQELTVSPVSTFDSLTVPTYTGYDFKGWYLDDGLTTSATGKIGSTAAVWAKWEKSVPVKTDIDFEEDYYQKATESSGLYSYNSKTIGYNVALTTDPDTASDHGAVINLHTMGGDWPNGIKSGSRVVLANEEGTDAFESANNAYLVSMDVKIAKSDKAGALYIVGSSGSLGWNQTYSNLVKVMDVPATSGGDWQRITVRYTATSSVNPTLHLYGAPTNNDTTKNQEIYVDNISIERITPHDLTIHNGNNGQNQVVSINQFTELSELAFPTYSGYAMVGWFTDAEFTKPAPKNIGELTDIYVKWEKLQNENINVINFNEPVYAKNNSLFVYNSSLGVDYNGTGDNAGLIEGIREPNQGWQTGIIMADAAGTAAFKLQQGATYSISYDIKRIYAERAFSSYMFVANNTGNIKLSTTSNRKLHSFEAATTADEDYVTYTATYIAPSSGTAVFVLVGDSYPDFTDEKVYIDNIVIEMTIRPQEITLHTNNDQADQKISVSLLQDFFTIAAPTRSGYIFAGWYTDDALTQPFEYANIDPDTFNVTDLYAKWQVAKEEGYSASFGFESDEFAYGNSGTETDTVNNATEKDAYVSTTDEEPYDGNGILVLSTATGNHSDAADHWASAALIDKDGNYFHTVKGTRYKLTFTMRSSGETSGTKYFYIGNSSNVPTGGVNSSNSSAIFSATTGSIDFPKDTYWFTKEVYFVAEKTEKVYLSAYSSTGNAYISFDEVSFEVADDSKTALVQWYNEDGTSLVHSALGATGEMMYSLPAAQTKTGYDFNGWRIGSSTGEQWISNLYPEDDLKLYASWVESKAIPENPVSPLDENDSIFIDFENINAAKAFYEESGNTTGPSYGLFMVSNDPDNAHSGSSYFRYYRASQWTKQWYRKMRFFDQNSPDGKVWLEPYTTYKISYWYNPDTVGASNLYLANFNDEYPDGYEILAENYLNDASIFEQFGKWNYYEATVFTGDYKGELGFVLYGGYFTVSIDDITVTKCKEVDLSFQVNGGSEVETISGMSHHTFIAPEDPTKEGYIFAGWYTDSALTKPFDFTTDTVDKAMTLYAKWDVKKYRTVVTYEENEVEVEVTPEDAHLDDAALFNDTNDKIGSISPDIVEEAASLAWLWILLAVLGGLILVAAIVLLIIILAKKRKKKEA